jgi:uncharacterized membrane protein YqiK
MAEVTARSSGSAGVGPLGSLLERFRRSGGVPAAVSDDLSAELLPVFAALEAVEVEAARIREAAHADAERRREAAAVQAERTLAAARKQAEAERARAEAARREAATAAARAVEAAALAEADRIRTIGRERIPALVDEIVQSVREGNA